MIGILGGMGTQAGLDFCNKLAMLNRGKTDQKYPLFILYNKSNIPGRPENLHKYNKVLKGPFEVPCLAKDTLTLVSLWTFCHVSRVFRGSPVRCVLSCGSCYVSNISRVLFLSYWDI